VPTEPIASVREIIRSDFLIFKLLQKYLFQQNTNVNNTKQISVINPNENDGQIDNFFQVDAFFDCIVESFLISMCSG
jgi:hypothetical protein